MPPTRALRLILLLGPLIVIGCGRHHENTVRPISGPQGVSPQVLSAPMNAISLTRFVVTTLAYDWNTRPQLDASWHYDASIATWAKTDSGYSQVFVGSPGRPTTEVRHETVVDMRIQLLRSGVAQAELATADQARMQLRVRQRAYTLGGPYVPDESYDLVTRTTSQFGLTNGSADTLEALGSVMGWWDHVLGSGRQRFDFGGTIDLQLDYPDHFVTCPAERMSADVLVFEDRAEVDRYSGSFAAAQDQDLYTGVLQSERGSGGFGIDENRGCPAAATPPTAPKRLKLQLASARSR